MKTLQQPYSALHFKAEKKASLIHRFTAWCKTQEEYRLGWLAIIIAGHGCFITPLTLFFVILAGNAPFSWALAIAAMAMSLVTNLAALPAKITIPVFFLSIVIDLLVVINCIATGLALSTL